MADWDLSAVDVVILDSQLHASRLVREMLNRLGIKKTEIFDRIDPAMTYLGTVAADLLLVDCDNGLETEAFRMIRAVRNDGGVLNPYAGVVVTTWQPTQAIVQKITNNGADTLLAKPFSPRQVLERIGTVIDSRRKFVVTADFLGPDRRKQPREGAQIPLFDVPNTLRDKALGQYDLVAARDGIATMNLAINDQKRLRTSIQVGFLVEVAVGGLKDEPPDRGAFEHILRVPTVLDELERRSVEHQGGDLASLCRDLRVLIETVRAAFEKGEVDKELTARLRETTKALLSMVDPSRSADAILREVRTAVAAYTVRLEAMLQAKAVAQATRSE